VFQELYATGMNSSGCLIVLHSGVVQGRKSTEPRSSLCSITRPLEIEGQLRGKFRSLTQRRRYSVIPGPSPSPCYVVHSLSSLQFATGFQSQQSRTDERFL